MASTREPETNGNPSSKNTQGTNEEVRTFDAMLFLKVSQEREGLQSLSQSHPIKLPIPS